MKLVFNWLQWFVLTEFFEFNEAVFGVDGQLKTTGNAAVGQKRPQAGGGEAEALAALRVDLHRTG